MSTNSRPPNRRRPIEPIKQSPPPGIPTSSRPPNRDLHFDLSWLGPTHETEAYTLHIGGRRHLLSRRTLETLAANSGKCHPYHCINTVLDQIRISGYITGNIWEITMSSSQKRAIQNYRSRLSERGLARFEVLGLDSDRDLIRSLARRLAEEGPEAARIRSAISSTISGDDLRTGGIVAALRRSPLVDSDLDLSRSHTEGRKIDL